MGGGREVYSHRNHMLGDVSDQKQFFFLPSNSLGVDWFSALSSLPHASHPGSRAHQAFIWFTFPRVLINQRSWSISYFISMLSFFRLSGVHNITWNFAIYPIFRFYRRGPIFFYRPKLTFWIFISLKNKIKNKNKKSRYFSFIGEGSYRNWKPLLTDSITCPLSPQLDPSDTSDFDIPLEQARDPQPRADNQNRLKLHPTSLVGDWCEKLSSP